MAIDDRKTIHIWQLEAAAKLPVAVGVINNVDEAGEQARIGKAKAVMGKLKIMVCSAVIRHRPQFQAAAEKGKSVVEAGMRAQKAAAEIRALWEFLDTHAKRLATAAKTKAKRVLTKYRLRKIAT
jgi:hypothetical protein